MKGNHYPRIVLSLVTGLLISGLLACGSGDAESSLAQERSQKEAIRILFEEVWNTGDVGPLRPWEADSVDIHYRGQTSRVDLDGLADLVAHWRSAFPDLRMEVLHLVAEDDLVAAFVRYEGTHSGTWFGYPATGKRMSVDEMMFFRFESGRLVEGWEVDDQLSMRTQLGILP